MDFAKTITVAMTGASGFRYGLRLVECLLQANCKVYLLVSDAARAVAAHEESIVLPGQTSKLAAQLQSQFQVPAEQLQIFADHEWTAPIASGSAFVDAMVVCPCSSGSLSAIASGASNNLIERAADVMLKEQRKLVLVHRETPVSAIHLENMLKLAKLGVVILPASPGFYHQPTSINDLIDFIVARILNSINVPHKLVKQWGQS
ncbi:MAG: UbiX family flavin prenyltransferase [Pseudomonadota bacterium]|nr:UbiX family flavin prenyltransferase [Pseudomonadota bacterium]